MGDIRVLTGIVKVVPLGCAGQQEVRLSCLK